MDVDFLKIPELVKKNWPNNKVELKTIMLQYQDRSSGYVLNVVLIT